jgi:competence protein ComEC
VRWPEAVERRVLGAAGGVCLGAGAAWQFGVPAVLVATIGGGAAVAFRPRLAVTAVLLVAGTISGALAAEREASVLEAEVPTGPVHLIVDVVDEGPGGRHAAAIVRPIAIESDETWSEWRGPPVAMSVPEPVVAGQRLDVFGSMQAAPARIRGDPVAGRLGADRISMVSMTGGPVLAAGNAIRDRVRSELPIGEDSGAALVAGFLIGDTSGVSERHLDLMRRSGLSHFVAVSGSNVALFLVGWWVLTAPLLAWPRLRAVGGMVGLAVFVVATRWEPSVLRASLMAGGVLLGVVAGLPFTGWIALAFAVGALTLVSGEIVTSVGFQLSVAATAGILIGGGMFSGRRPRSLWMVLGATLAAQVAVAPLLLIHFGSVPALAPLANLLAAPLVTAATISGALGTLTGVDQLVGVASFLARVVLGIAGATASWPQLGLGGLFVAAGLGLAALRRRWRPAVVLVISAAIVLPGFVAGRPPQVPMALFLDVGQGDAVLLRDPSGATVLVDGGRDPVVLHEVLRRHGVRHVDLLVVTHGDGDHVGGLDGIVGVVRIGRVWYPDHPDLGPALERLIAEAIRAGIVAEAPTVGATARAGSIVLEVIGPRRRYLAQNDGSLVLWVEAGRSLLLGGDIERTAQLELPELRPDVMLVPHHGSATSDQDWLRATVGDIAVVSVGENAYGHPHGEVMAVLEGAGAEIRITRDEGEVAVPLVRAP